MNIETSFTADKTNLTEQVDVLIIGAGISGLGAAHHLQTQCPQKSFLILEAKDAHGGTWRTHTYPGIRSDSDLYTFGYRFKPWTGAPVAERAPILDYLSDVIEDGKLDGLIRYNHRVLRAEWSSDNAKWTVTASVGDCVKTFFCNFLFMCQGYYDHDTPYMPNWPGFDSFQGTVVHPQHWLADLCYKDKRVVVIGSGATAATLIPNMADDCAHLTMLQRSPTYFWTGENRNGFADFLRKFKLPEMWVHRLVRTKILFEQKWIHWLSAKRPDKVKHGLAKALRKYISADDIRKHFTPTYRPWQQRIAYVPNGDLFKAVQAGKVDVVTDHIDHFTPTGIKLKSGQTLEADIVVSATGFNLLFLGGIEFDIDGKPAVWNQHFNHRGMMLSDVPNMAFIFGYLRTSWTMRVEVVCDYVCRLLNHMDRKGASMVVPTLREQDKAMARLPWLSEDEFNPGYMKRGMHMMPKNGDQDPWRFSPDYYVERKQVPRYNLDDETLVYRKVKR